MSSLKRKDAPGGDRPSKSAKKPKEAIANVSAADAKTSKKSKSAPAKDDHPKAPIVSILKDEEPMFPRGGGSVLTPLEQKQIQLEAKADAMRDDEFVTGKKSKKQKKKTTTKGEKKAGKSATEEPSVKVESLSFKVCLL
jgi:rRNA biogenesis protein RRP5